MCECSLLIVVKSYRANPLFTGDAAMVGLYVVYSTLHNICRYTRTLVIYLLTCLPQSERRSFAISEVMFYCLLNDILLLSLCSAACAIFYLCAGYFVLASVL